MFKSIKKTKSAKAVEERGQAKISTMFQCQYATSSTKHALVTKKLVKLNCCNSLSMSMVDFSEFHEFVQELDPLYRIPCHKEFGAAAEKMFVDLKSILNAQLTDAGKILIYGLRLVCPWCYCPLV